LDRRCNLGNPEEVKIAISKVQGANSYKDTFVKAYDYYVKINGLIWEKPRYKWERKIPKIPMTEQLTKIISSSSRKYSTIFRILMETGVTPKELTNLQPRDIDSENGILNFQGCKGHSSRSFKLKPDTHAMLLEYLRKYSSFPDSYWIGRMWRQSRKLASEKLKDSSLRNIRLYDLRHYFATMLYSRTRDILLVKQQMGHKKIETSLLYTQLVNFGSDDYVCKTAGTINEASILIEQGFEYVTEIDGIKLFRKRK
jgi:integrase